MSAPIYRAVTSFGYYSRSLLLKLECGHELRRKQSQGPTLRAKCHDCQSLRDGAVITHGRIGVFPAMRETWDPVKALPIRTELADQPEHQ